MMDVAQQQQFKSVMKSQFYYEFQLKLQRLSIDIDFPCSVQIWWKRGKNKATSKQIPVNKPIHYIDFNDVLKINAKCTLKDGLFAPLQTSIIVLLYLEGSNNCKQAGCIESFDITQIIMPKNHKVQVFKQFTLPLEKSPPNSKITFTLTQTFQREAEDESRGDISFQASSQGFFNRTSTDMTFRPPSTEDKVKRMSVRERGDGSFKQRNDERPEYNMSRADGREARVEGRVQAKQLIRIQPKSQQTRGQIRQEQLPLGFSFGPLGPVEKQKQARQMLDHINQLNHELADMKKQNQRLQSKNRQNEQQRNSTDQRKLQLINQLNATINQADQFKRQRNELNNQLIKCKDQSSKMKDQIRELSANNLKLRDENRQIGSNFNRLREQSKQQNLRYESKRKQAEELKQQLERMAREKEQFKNELFKKQSELIFNENRFEEMQSQYMNRSVPIMDELKKANLELVRQKTELERVVGEKSSQLIKEQQMRQSLQKNYKTMQQERSKQKSNLTSRLLAFEAREKENQCNINDIEQQMRHFMEQLQQKDEQIGELTNRLNNQNRRFEESGKKQEQVQKEKQTYQIQISELKVKVKNLEEICVNLEKDCIDRQKQITQKGQFIEKVREYVNKMQVESKQKDEAIKQRDQFIAKAKQFITTRQKQLNGEIQKLKSENVCQKPSGIENEKLKAQLSNLAMQLQQRQQFLTEVMEDANMKQRHVEQLQNRLDDLEHYVDMLQERLEITQDEMQELVRKTRSQQETLQELVKKNLQMEMQVNVKNFQIESLKRNR